MQRRSLAVVVLIGAMLALTGAAVASMMHPKLAARLSGMGNHGIANLNVTASSGKLCWTFDIPTVKGATRASIHTGQNGPMLLELGMHYAKTGCAKVSAMTLEHVEAKPSAYWLWVDTKSHPGDLRGALFAGTAQM